MRGEKREKEKTRDPQCPLKSHLLKVSSLLNSTKDWEPSPYHMGLQGDTYLNHNKGCYSSHFTSEDNRYYLSS
jgi:hypothetical protein